MRGNVAALCLAVMASHAPAQDAPQSVIPWLSDSLRQQDEPKERIDEPAATGVVERQILVQPLGAVRRDAVGLLSTEMTGLPRSATAGSDPKDIAALLARQPLEPLPAMRELVQMLLLAELDPPRAAFDPDTLFLARIDSLLAQGAVDQAQALLERAGAADPQAFQRWFDAALLTGDDARACEAMNANPGVAPTFPARIFCLTRGGDWAAAALTLETGRALGLVTDAEDHLLAHFLDPELFEGEPPPIPPRPMTPLAYRLLDGIGETPSTRGLPVAFAMADLRPNLGWKAQIEAAERLSRAGALDPNRLLALYTERRPSASGGVWERASAVQQIDAALIGGDMGVLSDALPKLISESARAGLLVPVAQLFGERLAMSLPQSEDALRLGLLSNAYEKVANAATTGNKRLAFAKGIAIGAPDAGHDPLSRAIAAGFATDAPEEWIAMARDDRLSEALLEASLALADGPEASHQDITRALALLRAVGLQNLARRTALQLWLL